MHVWQRWRRIKRKARTNDPTHWVHSATRCKTEEQSTTTSALASTLVFQLLYMVSMFQPCRGAMRTEVASFLGTWWVGGRADQKFAGCRFVGFGKHSHAIGSPGVGLVLRSTAGCRHILAAPTKIVRDALANRMGSVCGRVGQDADHKDVLYLETLPLLEEQSRALTAQIQQREHLLEPRQAKT